MQKRQNITDNYKLEAVYGKVRALSVNLICGALLLTVAIALKLCCTVVGTEALILDILSILFGVLSVAFLIADAVTKNREYEKKRAELEAKNAEAFARSTKLPKYSVRDMFIREFDVSNEEEIYKEYEREDGDSADAEGDEVVCIDKTLDFALASGELTTRALEKGLRFAPDTAKRLFASMTASRLLLVYGMEKDSFTALADLLGDYFGTEAGVESVESALLDGDLLYKNDPQGYRVKTKVCETLVRAQNDPQGIFFVALTDVRAADMGKYFEPYIRYAKSPSEGGSAIARSGKTAETAFRIPQNIWFILNMAQGERIDLLPHEVCEICAVNTFYFEKTTPAESLSPIHKLSYHQHAYLAGKASAECEIDEREWKKVDRLEEYIISRASSYRIGNKTTLGLEGFAFSYIACGGEPSSALDEALASRVLPAMLSVLKDAPPAKNEKRLDEALDDIFGEGEAQVCRKTARAALH